MWGVPWSAYHARLSGCTLPVPPHLSSASQSADSTTIAALHLRALVALPVPPQIPDSALNPAATSENSGQATQVSVHFALSWFDSQSGEFFGRTTKVVGCSDVEEAGRRARATADAVPISSQTKQTSFRRVDNEGNTTGFDGSPSSSASSSTELLPHLGDAGRVVSPLTAGITGRKITVDTDCTLFFHTPQRPPSLLLVIEAIVSVANSEAQTKTLGAGWALLPVFDTPRGGFDEGAIVGGSLSFHPGTPRLLLFLPSPLPNPPTSTIPNAALAYQIVPRADLSSVLACWPDWDLVDARVAPGGVTSITESGSGVIWEKCQWIEGRVQKLRLALHSTNAVFESLLLASVSSAALTSLNLPLPPSPLSPATRSRVTSRTLCIGTHNGLAWLSPPTRVSLAEGEGGWLGFGGSLEIPLVLGDSRCVVVVGLEYGVEVEVEVEKGDSGAKDGTKDGASGSEKLICERILDLGWGWWCPEPDGGAGSRLLALTHPPAPTVSPFKPKLVFRPLPEDLIDESGRGDGATTVTAPDRPVVVSFEVEGEGLTPVQAPQSVVRPIALPEPIAPPKEIFEPPPEPPREDPPTPRPARPPRPHVRSSSSASPSHPRRHPAPTFPLPVPHRSTWRTERARLHLARFPAPRIDGPAVVVSNEDLGRRADLRREVVQVQEVWITIGAITWETGDGPRCVKVTYRFWEGSWISGERAIVWTGDLERGRHNGDRQKSGKQTMRPGIEREEEEWPGVLWKVGKESNSEEPDFSTSPGVTSTHIVDPIHSAYSDPVYAPPGLPFFRYLAHSKLPVDIFDGESGAYVGQARVPLRGLLLDGRHAVTGTWDIDVVAEEPVGPVTRPATPFASPPERVVGKLHVVLTNVARPDLGSKGMEAVEAIKKREVVVRDFREGVKARRGQEGSKITAIKLIDTNPELQALFRRSFEERALARQNASSHHDGTKGDPEASSDVELSAAKKKAIKAKEWFLKEGLVMDVAGQYGLEFSYNATRQERQRDLQTITVFRERAKPSVIVSALEKSITSHHTIYPSFARACFFEFSFTNPYAVEHTFTISFDDEELRVVTDVSEWRYLRRVHRIPPPVETNLLRLRPKDGSGQVFLLPNETVSVPFIFQSFLAGRVGDGAGHRLPEVGNEDYKTGVGGMVRGTSWSDDSSLLGDDGAPIRSRTIKVSIINYQRKPIAILDLRIAPRNYAIDRSYRLYKAENEIARKTVAFVPAWTESGAENASNEIATAHDAAAPAKKYFVASSEDVTCTISEPVKTTSIQEVTFKCRSPKFPAARIFHLLCFEDPHHTTLLGRWRVELHSMMRMDVNCILGQTNTALMVVRGTATSRTVQCFSSLPEELTTQPLGAFILTANALNEVTLFVRPKSVGNKEILVNIMDVNEGQLIASWTIVCHCLAPTVTKSFDVRLQTCRGSSKRVSYTNPYPAPKKFTLRTDRPDLLSFKEVEIEMEAGGTRYIHIRFMPRTTKGNVEAFVFINDEQDRLEECLKVKCEFVE
ncbi:hypothetical protein M427DRAFT_421770 [Gonapodya prolifera JEL478]|uniref:Nephrocystin-4 n=1 Tax=Gonapodya prolifera (strain JEL478) TaxID=1344416 RepID=A0A139A4S2_GONPJ|nr:hypothetical protein M427DRAFT_421770 [Gonapodya prolifera JEL478]|eukprot:KXS11734.1 hypothetical protein M427DRAFT_421770 [Gonapodya prolifera JEL478]